MVVFHNINFLIIVIWWNSSAAGPYAQQQRQIAYRWSLY